MPVVEVPFRAVPSAPSFATPAGLPEGPYIQLQRPDDPAAEALIRIGRGQCMSGGYGIDVTAVRRDGSTVTINCRLSNPAPGAMVTMALTFPATVIAVPAAALPPPGAGHIVAVTADGRLLAKLEQI